jgi:hypothetical protein
MSDVPVEAAAPEPITATPATESPVQTEASKEPVTANADVEMSELEKETANGETKEGGETANAKAEEISAVKTEEAKPRQNGRDHPRNGNNQQKREKHNKYDPSKMEKSSNHTEIRNQVST